MRVLSTEECIAVGGGTGGRPATQIFLYQTTDPKVAEVKDNGHWTTQVQCSTPISAGIQFEINGAGKVFAIKSGVNVALPSDCHIITTNDKTGVVKNCDMSTNVCTVTDAAGHKISQITESKADTGWEQLMNNLDVFSDPDNFLVGGDGNFDVIYESGTEPGGYQPAGVGPKLGAVS